MDFLGHSVGLRRAARRFCELDHIHRILLPARWMAKPYERRTRERRTRQQPIGSRADKVRDQEKAMGQQFTTWRSGSDQRAWLSMLVDTMEEVSRPESQAVPCDSRVLAAFCAQLARPASAQMPFAKGYGLRN